MVAHVTVPALDSDSNRVATTLQRWFPICWRRKSGSGLVVTDALDMAGLTHLYANNIGRAAVEAFKAGNDMLIIPADLPASFEAMGQGGPVRGISRERLDRSVLKILRIKASLGLNEAREVDLKAVSATVGKPENLLFGQQVANSAITLVRDKRQITSFEIEGNHPGGATAYVQRRDTQRGRGSVFRRRPPRLGHAFSRELRRVPDARVIYVDPHSAAGMSEEVLKAVDEAQTVIAGIYVIPTAGRIGNTVQIADATGTLLEQLLRSCGTEDGGGSYGESLPGERDYNYMCTFSNATVSEVGAVGRCLERFALAGTCQSRFPMSRSVARALSVPPHVASGDLKCAKLTLEPARRWLCALQPSRWW